jgi:rhodanese-related sulfurtransferase
MAQTISRLSLLLAIGVASGLLSNWLSPKGIPWVTPPKKAAQPEDFLSLEKAYELWSTGTAFFLDARKPDDFAAGHIAQAFNLPAGEFEEHFIRVAPMLAPESDLIVYCEGADCELSHRLAADLERFGFTNVHMLFNGWTTWREAGYPIETGAQE